MSLAKRKRPSKLIVDLCVDIALIAGLVCLFVFPANFIARVSDELTAGARFAIEKVKAGEFKLAEKRLEQMQKLMKKSHETMHYFFSHDDILALDAAINGCKQLAIMEDSGQILVELESIAVRAEYLDSIEHFSIGSLL